MDDKIRKLLNDAARDAGAATAGGSDGLQPMFDRLIAKGAEEEEACFIINAVCLLREDCQTMIENLDHLACSHGSLSTATAMAAIQHAWLDAYTFLQRKCEEYKEEWPFDPRYIDFHALCNNTYRADTILKALVDRLGTKETMR